MSARVEAAGRGVLAVGVVSTLVGVGLLVLPSGSADAAATADAGRPVSASAMTLSAAEARALRGDDVEPDPASAEEPGSPTTSADPDPLVDPDAPAAPEPTPSATATGAPVPSSGRGVADARPVAAADPRFASLSVTVSQTDDLVNQGIRISWTGGEPTSPGEYATDYLTIMQCWGDDPAGPTPQQCQFGTPNATIGNLMGTNAAGRDLIELEDPAQAYSNDLKRTPPRTNPNLRSFAVPFQSVKGGAATFDWTKLFTASTTNEISAARTGADGTGSVLFEVQTSLEAPHLGCGAVLSSGAARSCWLVVIPRGNANLDGTLASVASASGRVQGSPLSASAWENRIVFPLEFQPVAVSCPTGNAERRVLGAETIGAAMTSWQPVLCTGGTTYGFSQLGDPEGRAQILSEVSGASRLAFVTAPVDASAAGDASLAYAPVARTAIVVAYNIDYSLQSTAANFGKNGTAVGDLTLNARLIAKLLTQSYRSDIPDGGIAAGLLSNPRSIAQDPEFLALNPEFAGFTSGSSPDGLLVALGSSDATGLVWSWLQSDPLARDFLAGNADEWGTKINPAYKSLGLNSTPTDSFPKADLSTQQVAPAPPPGFGTLDLRPYMSDQAEAAYRALRADANVKIVWDAVRTPPAYVSSGPQLPGQRFMLAITDAVAAERYGLNVARIVNAAGQKVLPTAASINAQINASPAAASTGVRPVNPGAGVVGGYPLALPVYAAVNVCAASKAELVDYAGLLDYAVGAGQVSGDARGLLPRGYVPLAEAEAKVATKLAAALRKGPDCTPDEEAPIDFGGGDYYFDPGIIDGGTIDQPATSDPEEQEPLELTATDAPLSAGRFGVAAALGLGIPCLVAGPLLRARGRRLP